jgi:hypothetical protein
MWGGLLVGGFVTARLAASHKLLLATSLILPGAALLALSNWLWQVAGKPADFSGIAGTFMVLVMAIPFGAIVCLAGGALGFLSTRRMTPNTSIERSRDYFSANISLRRARRSAQPLGIMSQPRYIQSQGAWLIPAPNGVNCEVLVAGDSNELDPARLAEAESVLRSLAPLRDRAAAHLDEFINRQKLAPGSEWFLEGIEFGFNRHAEGDVSMEFSLDGDTHGSWSVVFLRSSGQYWPVAFGRRQI